MQVLETYRTMSGTGFINAQTLSAAMKPIDDTIWQTRFMSPAARPRLFWQMSAGEPHIPYDGVPFMSIGQNTELPCVRYGGRRKKVETVALATGDLINMDYRQKTGCEAKITVRRIMRFPSAQVTDLSQQGVAAVRRMRKQLLEDLTQKIIAGIAKPMERYYFLLPTPLAHTNHVVPEMEAAPSIVQPVSDEIINQLSHGITEIALIRDHIKNFADASFGTEAALHADNPAYYPSEVAIYHHIYWLYKMGQVSGGWREGGDRLLCGTSGEEKEGHAHTVHDDCTCTCTVHVYLLYKLPPAFICLVFVPFYALSFTLSFVSFLSFLLPSFLPPSFLLHSFPHSLLPSFTPSLLYTSLPLHSLSSLTFLVPYPPPSLPPSSLSPLPQVIDQESAFKAKLALSEDQAATAAAAISLATSTPGKIPVTSDTITRWGIM